MSGVHWVLLHGWGSDSKIWRDLLEHWQMPVQLVDLAGFGERRDALTPDLDEQLRQIVEGLPPNTVLLGWSLGGMIATRIAYLFPEKIRGLVTIACNPCFVVKEQWPTAMLRETYDAFCEQFRLDPDRTWKRFCALQSQGDRRARFVHKRLAEHTGPPTEAAQWLTALLWLDELDNREGIKRLNCPQLHIFGERDALVPSSAAKAIPHSMVFSGVGHAPQLSCPDSLARELNEWSQKHLNHISKRRVTQSFAGSAAQYDASAHVQREIANQLIERTQSIPLGSTVVDLGCGTGFVCQRLAQRGVAAMALDIAEPMVRQARAKQPALLGTVGDVENLPFTNNCIDTLVSSLAFQWCADFSVAMSEAFRVLRPGGVLAFTTLASATLTELKQAWAQVDSFVHVNEFDSREQIVDQVEGAGFAISINENFIHTAHFNEVMVLLRELKAIGARNLNSQSNKGLTLRSRLRRLSEAYGQFLTPQGQYPASYDVVLVIARKEM